MSRWTLVSLLVLPITMMCVMGQVITPGSTVEGDYLRGLGIAASGMGDFNLKTAEASKINTETAIRQNDYVAGVVQYQSRQHALRREESIAKRNEGYTKKKEQIRVNPEQRDVFNGNALNSLKSELLDPAIGDSSLRTSPVMLPADLIRRIPFSLPDENATFSMHRLTATGKAQWTPALQDDMFKSGRRAYESALETVLEQQSEGKMSIESIRAVEQAVDFMLGTLKDSPLHYSERAYRDAWDRLTELKNTAHQVLQSHKAQLIIGQLDTYAGATVRDLMLFMQRNKVSFAPSDLDRPEERDLYLELFAALSQQRDMVKGEPKKLEELK
jgi:hypothetical protein